jgi:hypothetical protein
MQESLADLLLCASVDLSIEQRGGKSSRRLKSNGAGVGKLANVQSGKFLQYRSVLTAT